MKFSIGDLLVLLDSEVYFCIDIKHGTHYYEMLNPKKPHRMRKRLFNVADLKRTLSINEGWKHFPVKE
jgi:hypothetical protein